MIRFVFLLLAVLLPLIQSASAVSSVGMTAAQEKFYQAWKNVANDFDGLRSVYTDDAEFKMCMKGSPECITGDWEQTMEPFRAPIAKFTAIFNPIANTHNTLVFEWYDWLETPTGCGSMFTGLSIVEFDEETGKAKGHLSYSEDSERMFECIAQFAETIKTPEAE